MLAPGESKDILLTFKPCAAQRYKEVLPLEVGGLYRLQITVSGEGTPLRVEMAAGGGTSTAAKAVAFGAVPAGQSGVRTLRLANRGRAAALVSLAPCAEALQRLGVAVAPAAPVLLRPQCDVELSLTYKWVRVTVGRCKGLLHEILSGA